MQTDNLELKKLVYLYLMNYAKTQPDLAILAVNTFSKDCEDSNPLIRALAVRTMGCIRVDKITEYLCEPLRKCLKVTIVISRNVCMRGGGNGDCACVGMKLDLTQELEVFTVHVYVVL
jgi:hypothetical protein